MVLDTIASRLKRALSAVAQPLVGGTPEVADAGDAPAATDDPAPAVKRSADEALQTRDEPADESQESVMGPDTTALPVREGESPWTAEEVAGVREELTEELAGLNEELDSMEAEIQSLMSEAIDVAGDDQADSGSKTFEREHEMALAAGVREMRDQVAAALRSLDEGDYGICTSCGQPIGKLRLQAFPRASLCLACKQRQERR